MVLAINWLPAIAWAGGSGLNVLVVINQNSPNSIELGNYYCERRQIPAENVVRITWNGGNTVWSAAEFQSVLLQPVLQTIGSRSIRDQIDYVVLSMDIPFSIAADPVNNGTTSALFYGIKSNTAPSSQMQTNSYFGSEAAFAAAKPAAAASASFLATMLTANSLAEAKTLIDQGVTSDGTFPRAHVYLAKSSDLTRRIRYTAFDNTIFNTRLRGDYFILRTNLNSPYGLKGILGYQTGQVNFNILPETFVPGAMADSLTSFGGIIFGPNDHTTALAFIGAGAAGSYGTVSEPTLNTDKFPTPQNYFYQARGFSLAECYYQSLWVPHQGLIVAEPLAAPFAQPGTVSWSGVTSNQVLTGIVPMTIQCAAADPTRPLCQVDLFVDGKLFQTLTNVTPAAGNRLRLRLAAQDFTFDVPANATLGSVARGIATLLNSPAVTNVTKVTAAAFGDRVELRFLGTNRPSAPSNLRLATPGAPVVASWDGPHFGSEIGSASHLTTHLTTARPNFLDSIACGTRTFTITGNASVGSWVQVTLIKTNDTQVTVGYTNQTSGANTATVVSNLLNLINATPALQGPDGVFAEDFATAYAAQIFNLTARSPGLAAARTKVLMSTPNTLAATPGALAALDANLTDLQARNHLYVMIGFDELTVNLNFNTALLPDGYHELTAVAYEGSNVRTQARATIPVRVQNTSLGATLTLVDLADSNPVNATYTVQVSANSSNISSIKLCSTGGVLTSASGQSNPTMAVVGSTLGKGRHPIYALVENTFGQSYRTETRWIHLN